MAAAARCKLLEYGVCWAPVLVDGLPALWAVDSFGSVRKMRKIRPGDDEEAIGELLWNWLLTHHPQRKLELVSEPAPPAPAEPRLVKYNGRLVDERLLLDPRTPIAKRRYFDALVRSCTHRSGVLRFRD